MSQSLTLNSPSSLRQNVFPVKCLAMIASTSVCILASRAILNSLT